MPWFKRTTKGIRTSTEDKKTHLKVFGTNPQREK